MQVGITGARGFLGQHLVRVLHAGGHGCVAFSRSAKDAVPGCRETRAWEGQAPPDLRGLDAVVNLAGESILGPWTDARRRRIRDSRVEGTHALVRALPGSGVRALVNASAVGLYGDRGDEELTEASAPGRGFLADVCRAWETAAGAAEREGVRVAVVRVGFVLGPDGGAWGPLRRAFRLGLGGRFGDGHQWMPPVHVADVVGLFAALLANDAARGAFNAVGPEPVRNAEFTRAVARALHRPALLPVPAWALRTALGDLSHVMLDSLRVRPARAPEIGYAFRFPTLGAMLADLAA